METVENRNLRSPFFLSGFLPIRRKVSIIYPENVQLP